MSEERSGEPRRLLSKSKYVAGLQCEKLLWAHCNDKERIPPPDPETQWIFDQGHEVGRLAQQIAPGGQEVPFGSLRATVDATARLLPAGRPIYEASFAAADVYCRVDILRPSGGGRWDLLEVKSSTQVKEINLHDLAVQAHALRSAGVALDRLYLVHVDRDYVRGQEIDPAALFRPVDLTDRVRCLAAEVAPRLARFGALLDGPEPEVPIGAHCDQPYACPLKARCWAHVHEDAPTTLVGARGKGCAWLDRGLARAVDVPLSELSARQRIQVEALRSGKPVVDRDAIARWLGGLEYPLLLLDFEAFATAIPLLVGTRPYEPIPFQASVHRIEAPGATPTHHAFLATGREDPRPALIDFLADLPGGGSVLAWHASYERGVLDGLVAASGSAAVASWRDRLLDLEEPFRAFAYYHPAQRGSTSIKAVLPALTGAGYAGDAVEGGRQAARDFLRVVHADPAAPDRDAVLQALRDYCRKDTWAMVEILRVLERVARGADT